jgi:hypothetical protein
LLHRKLSIQSLLRSWKRIKNNYTRVRTEYIKTMFNKFIVSLNED